MAGDATSPASGCVDESDHWHHAMGTGGPGVPQDGIDIYASVSGHPNWGAPGDPG